MASRPPSELIAIQRDIDLARAEVAGAIADLETAAKSLATPDHWKKVAARSYAQRPEVWLGAAFGLGFFMGWKTFKPQPPLVQLDLADDE